MTDELLSCPFCPDGGNPELKDHCTIYVVKCKDCSCCILGTRVDQPDGTETEEFWEEIKQSGIPAPIPARMKGPRLCYGLTNA